MDNNYTLEERDFLKQIDKRIKYYRLQVKLSQEKLAFANALNVKLSDLLDF